MAKLAGGVVNYLRNFHFLVKHLGVWYFVFNIALSINNVYRVQGTVHVHSNQYYFRLDSSKQRKKLRRKISKEKESLHSSFLNYNRVADELLSNVEEILNGKFPWNSRLQPVDECK
jgi:hypothetical protein